MLDDALARAYAEIAAFKIDVHMYDNTAKSETSEYYWFAFHLVDNSKYAIYAKVSKLTSDIELTLEVGRG